MAFNSPSGALPVFPTPETGCSAFSALKQQLDEERRNTALLQQELRASQSRITALQFQVARMEALACKRGEVSWGLVGTDAIVDQMLGIGDGDNKSAQLVDVTGTIGRYCLSVRRAKIAKYKAKLQRHRNRVPVSREYRGRSRSASQKLRERGRFVRLPLSL